MVDEVLIVQRHDVVQIRRYGDAFLAHGVFSFYEANDVFAMAVVRMYFTATLCMPPSQALLPCTPRRVRARAPEPCDDKSPSVTTSIDAVPKAPFLAGGIAFASGHGKVEHAS